jgi:hypothetical protein
LIVSVKNNPRASSGYQKDSGSSNIERTTCAVGSSIRSVGLMKGNCKDLGQTGRELMRVGKRDKLHESFLNFGAPVKREQELHESWQAGQIE